MRNVIAPHSAFTRNLASGHWEAVSSPIDSNVQARFSPVLSEKCGFDRIPISRARSASLDFAPDRATPLKNAGGLL
jgi:hypothetical protein